jgi:hypothetical protein
VIADGSGGFQRRYQLPRVASADAKPIAQDIGHDPATIIVVGVKSCATVVLERRHCFDQRCARRTCRPPLDLDHCLKPEYKRS